MHEKLDLERLSPMEAAITMNGLAEELADGVIAIGQDRIKVTGPMSVSIKVDASHALAHIEVHIDCRRPDGGSRLLQEELARPGG